MNKRQRKKARKIALERRIKTHLEMADAISGIPSMFTGIKLRKDAFSCGGTTITEPQDFGEKKHGVE